MSGIGEPRTFRSCHKGLSVAEGKSDEKKGKSRRDVGRPASALPASALPTETCILRPLLR